MKLNWSCRFFFTVLQNKIIVILNFFSGEESIIHLLSVYLSIYLTTIHKIQYSSLKLEHTDHKMMINVFIQNVLKVIFVFFRSLFYFTEIEKWWFPKSGQILWAYLASQCLFLLSLSSIQVPNENKTFFMYFTHCSNLWIVMDHKPDEGLRHWHSGSVWL